MKEHFTIVIPTFNCEAWVSRNLSSVINQNYDEYDIVYIDDHSTDGTASIVEEYIENNSLIRGKFEFKINPFNKGKMENLYNVIHSLRDDTIVVILDGDDWLYNSNVLSKLNEVYESSKIWMTNGSYVVEPTGEVVNPKINSHYWAGSIRSKTWEFSHLGTFRKQLFCNIKRKDLMNKTGEFWSTTGDQAMMWPMAEMSGPAHFKAIGEVLYVYNRLNPLSDDRVNRTDQLMTEQTIRSLKPYQRLASL